MQMFNFKIKDTQDTQTMDQLSRRRIKRRLSESNDNLLQNGNSEDEKYCDCHNENKKWT